MEIVRDDLSRPEVIAFIDDHLTDMYAWTPAESVHALDHAALRASDLTFWTAWSDDDLLGCAALKEVSDDHGEIKAMRTAPQHRGIGVAGSLLRHLVGEANHRGYVRLSLETGTQEQFAAARRLYAAHGFAECPPFGSYGPDPLSHFMTRELP